MNEAAEYGSWKRPDVPRPDETPVASVADLRRSTTRWSADFQSTRAGPACTDWSTKYSRPYEDRTERTARPMNFSKEVNDVYEAGGFGLHTVGHH
jgi:hypothetical protein